MQQREGLENRLEAEAVYKYKEKHNTKTNCFFVTLKFPKLEKISKAKTKSSTGDLENA